MDTLLAIHSKEIIMNYLIAPILFGTLTLIVLAGFFIIIKNEIRIRKFSAAINKKLEEQDRKLAQERSKFPGKVKQLLAPPLLLPGSKSNKAIIAG